MQISLAFVCLLAIDTASCNGALNVAFVNTFDARPLNAGQPYRNPTHLSPPNPSPTLRATQDSELPGQDLRPRSTSTSDPNEPGGILKGIREGILKAAALQREQRAIREHQAEIDRQIKVLQVKQAKQAKRVGLKTMQSAIRTHGAIERLKSQRQISTDKVKGIQAAIRTRIAVNQRKSLQAKGG